VTAPAEGAAGFRLLHDDAQLVAIDKPPGRIVIPGRGTDERSLREELEERLGRLWVVHRLDRGTSGVLVFARSAEAHRALNLAFERGEPAKRYVAIVRGTPPAEQRVEIPIAPARRGRMRPARPGDPRAKEAATVVRLLESFPARPWAGGALALVEALPETGRTHQIRVHLAAVGLPLAVDADYGDEDPLRGPAGEILVARTPLHAASLTIAHPADGRPLVIEAALPTDMASAITRLRDG
jgi:tRNA pseudouridine32 synthase/23S rRNA pseudouridine746 synthase